MKIFVKISLLTTLTLEVEPFNSIDGVKLIIQVQSSIHPRVQCLVFAGTMLEGNRRLSDYNITNESIIILFFNPAEVYWSNNIVQHTVNYMEKVRCCKPAFTLQFRNDTDLSFLSRARPLSDMQNRLTNYWSGIMRTHNILLNMEIRDWFAVVELSAEFARTPLDSLQAQIDAVRYKMNGINGTYYGGQVDSWQRFTTKLPAKIEIKGDEASHTVKIMVTETLKPNTRYALICLHSSGFNPVRSWFEDFLLPFTTEAAIPSSEITIQEQISFGAFSTVFRATWRETAVALKVPN
jgi:hypothetical protein